MDQPRKKHKKVKLPASKMEDDDLLNLIPEIEKININKLVSQSVIRYKDEQLLDKRDKLKELSHLTSICQEYLSTFALIGYSLQGERVVMMDASTPKDEAALVDLLRATFLEIVNNRP